VLSDGLSDERDHDETVTDIVQVLNELLKLNTELSCPPVSLEINDIINSMKTVKLASPFAEEKLLLKKTRKKGSSRLLPLLTCYGFICMRCSKNISLKTENPDRVIMNISQAGFTDCTMKLHQFP